jgi:hypothetical protein
VKNAYDAILSTMNLSIFQEWKKNIWKWGIPLKITLFLWLAVEGRLSTWDKLQAKGWIGSGICLLCNKNAEDIAHLFIHCPFVVLVWANCAQLQNTIYIWIGNTINQCMEEWVGNKAMTKRLPALVCWHIWLECNNLLFEGKGPSTWSVAHRTLNMLRNLPNGTKTITKILRVNSIFRINGYSLAFFDGASMDRGSNCGAGGTIFCSDLTKYRWHFNGGAGTNTKAELLGAWASLFLAKKLDI